MGEGEREEGGWGGEDAFLPEESEHLFQGNPAATMRSATYAITANMNVQPGL